MPRFFSIHHSPGMSREDFAANAADLAEQGYAQHVTSFVNFIDGTIVNLFDADSDKALIRELERLGWPYDEIHECHLTASTDELLAIAAT